MQGLFFLLIRSPLNPIASTDFNCQNVADHQVIFITVTLVLFYNESRENTT